MRHYHKHRMRKAAFGKKGTLKFRENRLKDYYYNFILNSRGSLAPHSIVHGPCSLRPIVLPKPTSTPLVFS